MKNIFAYYINVYRTPKGDIEISDLFDTEDKAKLDAISSVLDYDYTYVDTLTNYSHSIYFENAIRQAHFERDHPKLVEEGISYKEYIQSLDAGFREAKQAQDERKSQASEADFSSIFKRRDL